MNTNIPEGIWVKCPKCQEILYKREVERNLKVCPRCDYHFFLTLNERLKLTVDEDSFVPFKDLLSSSNPLNFPEYSEKIAKAKAETGFDEAIISGEAKIEGKSCILGLANFQFMGASMGSVFGERFVRMIERASKQKLPVIMFSCSGGARMQEGILSLMQLPKTAAAIARLDQNSTLYISVLTDPTFAGVYSSFASLGDLIIAEKGARVGFAGRRVIELAGMKIKPEVQTAEYQYKSGMIDLLLPRSQIRPTLSRILKIWQGRKPSSL